MSVIWVSTSRLPSGRRVIRAFESWARLLRIPAATPMPICHLRRASGPASGCACTSRTVRRRPEAFDQLAVEKGRCGPPRDRIGLVADAQLDRVDLQLLGKLVHRASRRAGRPPLPARASHCPSGRSQLASRCWSSGPCRHRAGGSRRRGLDVAAERAGSAPAFMAMAGSGRPCRCRCAAAGSSPDDGRCCS